LTFFSLVATINPVIRIKSANYSKKFPNPAVAGTVLALSLSLSLSLSLINSLKFFTAPGRLFLGDRSVQREAPRVRVKVPWNLAALNSVVAVIFKFFSHGKTGCPYSGIRFFIFYEV
jgi:hypothetical protein